MSALVHLCRLYQSLFRAEHPEEARLVALDRAGQRAAFLDEYFHHEYAKGLAILERFAPWSKGLPAGAAVLDFGCGAGGLTCQIAPHFGTVVGLDLEFEKLAYARQQAPRLDVNNTRFVGYNGSALPFADGSFDAIYCIDVMEHLPQPHHFLAEFARVLKPGGLLFISFGPPWGHPHGKHLWSILPGWWSHLIFPRRVVMEVCGFPGDTTWEQLGTQRLTVAAFERAVRGSMLREVHREYRLKRALKPLAALPGLRELLIAEVVAVYRRPAA